jgi:DNA repair protein SbcD/Mre11
MEPFRFLHTADLHLGTPFRGVSNRLPEDWMKRVRMAADQAFDRVVDIAIREQVHLVTIAGDLFDSQEGSMPAQFALLRGFNRLRDAGIPVILCHGNHDPLPARAPVAWPDNVHVLGPLPSDAATSVDTVKLTLASGSRVQIAGFSYVEPELRRSVVTSFHRDESAEFAIALLHGAVGPASEHANYAPATVQELSTRGFDVWALGHIHQPAILQEEQPFIFYPGNPQGRHPNEQGIRGVRVVDVSSRRGVTSRFLPTSNVLWLNCEVSLSGKETMSSAVAAIVSGIQTALPEAGWPAIVRCRLTGQTPLHAQLVSRENMVSELIQEAMIRSPEVWIERCDVATRPAVDLAVLADSHEFVGEFLRTTATYRDHPEKLRAALESLLSDVFHKGNELSLEDVTETQMLLWLDEAVAQFLQYVGEVDAE